MANVILLNARRDVAFFNEGRRDPITKELFQDNDLVVICARCKTVFKSGNWDEQCSMSGCGCRETLDRLPEPMKIGRIGRPSNPLPSIPSPPSIPVSVPTPRRQPTPETRRNVLANISVVGLFVVVLFCIVAYLIPAILALFNRPVPSPIPTAVAVMATVPTSSSTAQSGQAVSPTNAATRQSSTALPPPSSTRIPPDAVLIESGSFIRGSSIADLEYAKSLCEAYKAEKVYMCEIWASMRRHEVIDSDARLLERQATASPTLTPPSNPIYIASRSRSVNSFYIDRYEVTNERYKECVNQGPCSEPYTGPNPRHLQYRDVSYAKHPVIYVSLEQAKQYCSWAGGRLPYTYEWEKAARGTDGRVYPWGANTPIGRANIRSVGTPYANESADGNTSVGNNTARVGSFGSDRSPYGLMDMAGNVSEWVLGGNELEFGKVEYRGGSWNQPDFTARTANRTLVDEKNIVNQGFFDIGFRCAYDKNPK